MKKLTVLLAAALLMLAACALETHDGSGINAYYISTDGGAQRLVPHRLDAPEGASADELVALVSAALTAGDGTAGQSPVPPGVSMAVTRSGSVAEVDFSGEFAQLSAGQKSLVTAAVALSLLEIDDISYVYMSIEDNGYPPFYDRAVTSASFVSEEAAKALFRQQ